MDTVNNMMNSFDNIHISNSLVLVMSGAVILILLGLYVRADYLKRRFRIALKVEKKVYSLGAEYVKLLSECNSVFTQIEDHKKELLNLDAEKEELDRNRAELELLDIELNKKYEENSLIRNEARELEDEIAAKKNELEEIMRDSGDPERIKKEVEWLNQELNTLTQELVPLKVEHEKILAKIKEVADAEVKLSAIATKCGSIESNVQELIRERDKLKEEHSALKDEINKLELEKDKVSSEISLLADSKNEDDTAEVDEEDAFRDLLAAPGCCNRSQFLFPNTDTDEDACLHAFKAGMKEKGVFFHERVINAFHTSLKCQDINPLTVLAGVSGTGKTLLPIEYTKYMGMYSLVMPVQPRWDSSQDLFGFYDYIQKKYKATDLARCLLSFDPYNQRNKKWINDRMLLVLLDEMNLARTEYYFSEFLSKLELRRTVNNIGNKDERVIGEVELDVGANASINFNRIWVNNNILFVGTMNEDESTQTLSDKVLDRSNVLRFGRPSNRHFEEVAGIGANNNEQNYVNDKYLNHNTWKGWIKTPSINDSWDHEVNKWIQEINNALAKIGRPFGFRVGNAIRQYVANYPEAGRDYNYKLAFADQLEQKIIPKLRGIELGEGAVSSCLSDIENVISQLGDRNLSYSFDDAKRDNELGLFNWHGVTRDED